MDKQSTSQITSNISDGYQQQPSPIKDRMSLVTCFTETRHQYIQARGGFYLDKDISDVLEVYPSLILVSSLLVFDVVIFSVLLRG